MPELLLKGCRPEPLMSYLKALGVLRLVAEQKDGTTRGHWKEDGTFALRTELDAEELIEFFLDEYSPTPLLAPWGARSGFYGGSSERAARESLVKLVKAKGARFDRYRTAVQSVRGLLTRHKMTAKQKDEDKLRLMRLCRQELSDDLLRWLDAVYVLSADSREFPPLLGTGGNEGSGSYTSGFAQQLVETVVERRWDEALRSSLLGAITTGSTSEQTPGQFSPGAGSGANLGQGFERVPATNPWDYILALEGTCLWASVVARSMRARTGIPVSPFTFSPISAGAATLSPSDSRRPRAAKRAVREMWVPIWSRPSSSIEVTHLISEGRATVNRRDAASGVDMVQAIGQLGIDRGIRSFHRYSFLMRNGQTFYAAPLGAYHVGVRPELDLLRDIESRGWLARFRRECHREGCPPRFQIALRRFDQAVFDFCRYGGPARFANILCALGAIERELSRSRDAPGRIGGSAGSTVLPLPALSPDWLSACDDGSLEFRVALALASIIGDTAIGPLRTNLEPVEWDGKQFSWAQNNRSVVWSSGGLCRNLLAALERRVTDAGRFNLEFLPLRGKCRLDIEDVAHFISGDVDDRRIAQLLWGAVLVRQDVACLRPSRHDANFILLPRSYAVLKLVLSPDFKREDGRPVRPEPEILARLRANDIAGACRLAARRLSASGFVPMPGPTSTGRYRPLDLSGHPDPLRLAAALLIPVRDTDSLARTVLRQHRTITRN